MFEIAAGRVKLFLGIENNRSWSFASSQHHVMSYYTRQRERRAAKARYAPSTSRCTSEQKKNDLFCIFLTVVVQFKDGKGRYSISWVGSTKRVFDKTRYWLQSPVANGSRWPEASRWPVSAFPCCLVALRYLPVKVATMITITWVPENNCTSLRSRYTIYDDNVSLYSSPYKSV